MSEMAKCGQTNAGKNVGMSKAHNERMTLEQQIQPLVTKDIRTFFPAMVVRIGLSDISPLRAAPHHTPRLEPGAERLVRNGRKTKMAVQRNVPFALGGQRYAG